MAHRRTPELGIEIEWNEGNKDALIKHLCQALAKMAAREDDERENGPLASQSLNAEESPVPHKRTQRRNVQS